MLLRTLQEIAQSRSLPAGFVFRAKLILLLAEGLAYSVIKGAPAVHGKTAARHTSEDFVEFLGEVVTQCCPNQEIHIILITSRRTNQSGWRLSISASASAAALHSDLLLPVESSRDLVRKDRARRHCARRIHFGYINAYSANAKPIRWKYADDRHHIRSYDLAATGH
jgi:hypothetical protein